MLTRTRFVFLLLVCALLMGAIPFRYTENKGPSTLNPLFANDMYSVRITELLFDRLIGWDANLRPGPALAKSWTISPSRRNITIKLRKDVLWHDGKQFTSKDVAFTIRAMISRKANLQNRYLSKVIKSVKETGRFQLDIAFRKKMRKPLRWLQFHVLPAHRFTRSYPRRKDYFNQKPIGTGPFEFAIRRGRKWKLRRFTRYWKQKATMRGVTLYAVPDKAIQLQVLLYGGFDAIVRVRPKALPTLSNRHLISLYPYTTKSWWYLGCNMKRSRILYDIRVRKALLYALDRQTILNAQLGSGNVISGPFSPGDPLYNFKIPPRQGSRRTAQALLSQAGWMPTSSGIRERGTEKLILLMPLPRSYSIHRALLLAMQGQWRKVGIKVKLQWVENTQWRRRVMTKRRFDLTLHRWNFDDLATIHPLFHSKGTLNYVGYNNKRVDRLLTLASKTSDPSIYKAIHNKLHKQLHKDLPYLFLWSLTNYTAISSRVRGVTLHPFHYFHSPETWYVR